MKEEFLTFSKKILIGLLLVLVVGVPVLETWKVLCLAVGWQALVFSTCKPGWWRGCVVVGIVFLVMGIKALLPHADIAEGHNPFKVIKDGEALQQGLPPEVFASWKAQFDIVYPPSDTPNEAGYLWRLAGAPKSLFTKSSDAIWRKAKYTRQVDSIDFRSLAEFRGGFANELQYNYWEGELLREWMPFFVMYELTRSSVGSKLSWKGQLFWERLDGGFEEIVHTHIAEREIKSEDAGKRVYAVFFPKLDPNLYFKLKPSLLLRCAGWADAILTIFGLASILLLLIHPRWGSFSRAFVIFGIGYLLIVGFISFGTCKYLGTKPTPTLLKTYPPHGGGDDGIVHDGYGREMAMLAGRGEITQALRGMEDVYWFTPGTRYFRMAEKLVFGDTNHGYSLFLACMPIVIFYLIKHFVGIRWTWVLTVVFCFLPVGNFSYLQFLYNAKLGYGEALGEGLYLLGLVLMLTTQPRWGGSLKNIPLAYVAGSALAASMFIRPNFAFAVVWLGAAYVWSSWTRRDLAPAIAVSFGLSLALWMPFHNWFYGNEFYLISKSGAIAVPLGLMDYLSAMGEVLRGHFDGEKTNLITKQLKEWLFGMSFIIKEELRPLAWVAHGLKLISLCMTFWVVLRWVTGRFKNGADLAVVAVAAICAQIPMMFIFSTNFRYAMLGWDLGLVVLIVFVARLASRSGVHLTSGLPQIL